MSSSPRDEILAWINKYAETHQYLAGLCASASKELAAAFPTLRIVRGHVSGVLIGRRGHWWCEDPDGTIYDPTRRQFPGPMDYEEWQPGTEVRVGRCMNCGDDIYEIIESLDNVVQKCCCSEACAKELR